MGVSVLRRCRLGERKYEYVPNCGAEGVLLRCNETHFRWLNVAYWHAKGYVFRTSRVLKIAQMRMYVTYCIDN